MKYPGSGYKPKPRLAFDRGECPEIHCRFKERTFKQIAEIAEKSERSLNKTVATLVELVLPYIEIREITEPHTEIIVNLPDRD